MFILTSKCQHLFVDKLMNTDDKSCGKVCESALSRLENIDDDAARHGIKFVKSSSSSLISRLTIETLPALIFFDDGEPVRYNGKGKAPV